MIKFEIPVKLINNNTYLRMHWAKRKQYHQCLEDEIYCAVPYKCNNGPPRAKKTVRMTYITKAKKPYDKDNLYGMCKPVVDRLVDLELLRDDSPDCLDLHAYFKRGDKYKLIVEIF